MTSEGEEGRKEKGKKEQGREREYRVVVLVLDSRTEVAGVDGRWR